MVNQKLISFKVDQDQLDLLDSYLPRLTGYNRNKFLNTCLRFVLSCVTAQFEYNDRTKKDGKIPFLYSDID